MSVKLLTKYHLELLNLEGGCTGSSESTLVKMPHCWKSHALAQIFLAPWLNEKQLTIWVNNLLYCSGCEFSCQ